MRIGDVLFGAVIVTAMLVILTLMAAMTILPSAYGSPVSGPDGRPGPIAWLIFLGFTLFEGLILAAIAADSGMFKRSR